jgi:hypothetical protein
VTTDERIAEIRAMVESKKGAYANDLSRSGRDAWIMCVAADALLQDRDAALARLAEAEAALHKIADMTEGHPGIARLHHIALDALAVLSAGAATRERADQ